MRGGAITEVPALQYVLLDQRNDAQSRLEKDLGTVEEEIVPDLVRHLRLQVVREQTHEPLQGDQRGVKIELLEVVPDGGHYEFDHLAEEPLVDQHADHHRVVVNRQYAFDDVAENPEGFFLVEVSQEVSADEVEALAISHGGVAFDVGA